MRVTFLLLSFSLLSVSLSLLVLTPIFLFAFYFLICVLFFSCGPPIKLERSHKLTKPLILSYTVSLIVSFFIRFHW